LEVTYHGVYDRAEDGSIWGYAPEFPGAYGAGDTLEEAQASLREGIRLWLEIAREDGTQLPTSLGIADELVELPAV
jgi:predicted RNase H-like HicB family nuclease